MDGMTDGAAARTQGEAIRPRWGPLVIVGQARSGTSFLTRLLADTRRFALINDAYLIQYLDGLTARNTLSRRQRRDFADFVLTQIRTRTVSDHERQMYRSIYLPSEQLGRLEESADRCVQECETGWDLIEALLSATAALSGCDVWGWKCPPDYLHVDRIRAHFPSARFIFVIRNPFKMMRSYKNWPWAEGRSRYHPLIQAMVWRSVAERSQRTGIECDAPILLVRFEDLVDETPTIRAQLRQLLGEFPWPDTAKEVMPNTSLTNSSRELTWIEWKICKVVAGPYLDRLNYKADLAKRERLGGLELLRVSVRCIGYYASLALRSRDMRKRIKRHMATLRFRRGRALESARRPGSNFR